MKIKSQCLMCKYVFGRKCNKTNEYISDNIYYNDDKCLDFISITEENADCDDSCCSESKRYNSLFK